MFDSRTALSNNTSVLTAKATSSAIAGKYSVQVQQLASSSKVGLQSVDSSSSTKFNSGKLTISTGSSNFEVNVTAANNTLAGVRDAINAQGKSAGVSATIVTDSSGSRLVLSSSKTGEGNDIEVAATEDGVTTGTVALTTQAFKPSSSLQLPSFAGGPTSTFQGGDISISSGDVNLNVTIPDGFTMEDVRDLININGNPQGISAAIQTDASGARLVLSSSNGTDLTASATSSGGSVGSNALTTLNPATGTTSTITGPNSTTGAAGIISKAQSAVLFVDGLKVVSDSNSVTSAIDGVTLNLAGIQSSADIAAGKTVDVTIGVDKATVKTNLQKFVDGYNSLMTSVGQMTAVVPMGEGENPVTGALVGDVTARGLVSGLRSELVKMAGGEGIQALAQLGITTQKDGTLKIDDTKLTTALDSNFEQVSEYLAGDNGLMGRLEANVNNYLKSDGVLDQRTKALQSTLSNIDDQREALDMRIAKVQDRLVAQYTAMDQLVSRLQKTSESLANQLASLPGLVKKD
ncbi:flagellar filament capping protein FliD [Pseudomonas sp. PDM15]|nr:flagellar filament capping protein FliD [Pseudomonas sp. PDM15]